MSTFILVNDLNISSTAGVFTDNDNSILIKTQCHDFLVRWNKIY